MRDIVQLVLPDVNEYLGQDDVQSVVDMMEDWQPDDAADLLLHLTPEYCDRLLGALPRELRIGAFLAVAPPSQMDLIGREALGDWQPADVAQLLEEAEDEHTPRLFAGLPLAQRVLVFENLEEDDQLTLIERLGRESMARVIDDMSADERTDLFQALPDRTRELLLPMLAQVKRNEVARLSSYDDGTAGALMTTEYTSLPAGVTVAEALTQLRAVAPNRETIYYVYLVDDDRKLQGMVSLRELVLARPEQKITEIMNDDVISCGVAADQEDVAQIVERYDFLAVPVVDEEQRLVGIVTHDDALDVVREEATEDAHRMGAVAPLEAPYEKVSFAEVARKRAGWLVFLFAAAIATAFAMTPFEDKLQEFVLLMFFLPLVISQGGNSGSQAATIITRALALDEVQKSAFRVAGREAGMGLTLGLMIGGLAFLTAWGFATLQIGGASTPPLAMATVIGSATLLAVLFGSVLGSALPVVLKSVGADPAYASAPLVAAIMDVMGVSLYLGIAVALI
ncbi:MAG: magnesium transporter [Planctomycetota bacterium]|jgi:magnesium transporter